MLNIVIRENCLSIICFCKLSRIYWYNCQHVPEKWTIAQNMHQNMICDSSLSCYTETAKYIQTPASTKQLVVARPVR